MSKAGPNPSIKAADQCDFEACLDEGISAFEYDFGADVFKDVWGNADVPPKGLLWLANRVYDTTVAVVECVATCRRRLKIN